MALAVSGHQGRGDKNLFVRGLLILRTTQLPPRLLLNSMRAASPERVRVEVVLGAQDQRRLVVWKGRRHFHLAFGEKSISEGSRS